jgi:hypothetical protein
LLAAVNFNQMDIEKAKKASELLEQINELSKYKKILENKEHGRIAHFEICQHYGNNPDRVVFEHKYTSRFVQVVEQIVKELNDELSAL